MKNNIGMIILISLSFACIANAITLVDSQTGGTFYVGNKTCSITEDCPGTNEFCFCSNRECIPCEEGYMCSNYECIENRSIQILEPRGTVSGTVSVHVKALGNKSSISSISYAYNNISSVCNGTSFKKLAYNSVGNYYEDPTGWNVQSLTEGNYYFCVKAIYRDGEQIDINETVTVRNYDFTLSNVSGSLIKTNEIAVYVSLLNNTGLTDNFTITKNQSSPLWNSSVLINNNEITSLQLRSKETATIKITVTPPSNATALDYMSLTLTISTPHDTKSFVYMTTISSVSNKAPEINNIYHDPIKVRKGERLTFFVNITDPENDNITTKMVCEDASCTRAYCNTMSYSSGIYTCSLIIDKNSGIYDYYIYAKDSNNLSVKSDRKQFLVVKDNYCDFDSDCNSNEKCVNNECISGGCRTNSDCDEGKKCDLETGTCVECLQNSDCAGTDSSCGCSLITKKCQVCPNNYKCQNYVCVFQIQNGTVETFSGGTRYPDGHIVPFTGVNPAPNAVDANNDGDYTDPTDDFNGNGIDNKNDTDPFKTGGDSSIMIIVIAIVIAGVLGFVYFKYLKKGGEEAILEKLQRERGY